MKFDFIHQAIITCTNYSLETHMTKGRWGEGPLNKECIDLMRSSVSGKYFTLQMFRTVVRS